MNSVRRLARLNTFRRINLAPQRINIQALRQSSDHSHDHGHHDDAEEWDYRFARFKEEEPKKNQFYGEVIMTFTWWWIFWHCFTQPDVLFGYENPPTFPEKWTDEELGIPPDDE